MMSHKELIDEMKESEGDPHFKHARRSKGQEIVMQQVAAEVPKADVIIVNPTHYAVALAWSRKRGEAPKCLAKGVDEVAARIREIAQANGIPIHSDPPTARALYGSVPVGQE
ncbi:MAG: flagellar biosynthesis protein FlhB, partial [Rhodobacteraceae bacterium]|nr:flagellar biosynthesis protein FlhB [Paracoccaceae bacterium]